MVVLITRTDRSVISYSYKLFDTTKVVDSLYNADCNNKVKTILLSRELFKFDRLQVAPSDCYIC